MSDQHEEMLLRNYEPEIVLPPCDPGRETVNVIGHIMGDISPVFPYLNAILPAAQYNAKAQILRFPFEGHMVTLQPNEMAAGGFADSDAAIEALARLQRLINETWARRHEIESSYVERKRLTPMEVYKLLPKTNCKACGQPTCFVFATKLAAGEARIEDCTPLFTDVYREQREQLQARLALTA